jgi:hypothetical protein
VATDLNTESITSNHYEVFLQFLIQSPWTAESPQLNPIVQFRLSYSQSQITLRLAVYRQSVHFGVKPLEIHKEEIFFSTEFLRQ